MSIKITMPALSPTMETGNLAKWLVKEGDSVRSGDVIAEIETDKATMEVEAADEGVVAKLVVPAGSDNVKVNSLIAVLAEEGEDAAQVAKNALAENGSAAVPAPQQQQAGTGSALPVPAGQNSAAAGEQNPVSAAKTAGIFASPLARRLAAQAGLNLTAITGSGPRGRIIQRDVEAAKRAGGAAAAAGAAAGSAPAPAADESAILAVFRPEDYKIVPHQPIRKVIARRLVESKQHIPHFYVTADCNLDALLKLRSDLNMAAPVIKKEEGSAPAYRLSVNDMIIKAVAVALKRVPDANVSWLDSGMIRHKHSDIGVAVAIPDGLITPIIRQAEEKSLSAISAEMKDLIKRAKQMKLKPEEYQGGTSSVSNMGMFGVKDFAAIINPPQATIFAIGAGEKRATVKDGAVVSADIMSVTLSADHRAVDGALAAELVQCFKNIIENPLALLI
ncbi:pyruvate dehydrogenase complex dihydrolipoamide acetyltransferase [Candidatus Tokpelaia sp.]|uniref:pyruvate dehydrogenase complex dihydrolipoamide acetyltransferase n=1 Tax=Candidatus Tokpelaia sp. TaxID=2233777 RepID=UPI001239F44A|nr:pyruvate dehydrogenase complex dihydrolipoamide acetyltransferase [Candidatus Tokpelaia sp.]KAA6404932.1 pyruvate dehydrogenase complex dihydrolipoamide acetyltransferase [Candidatus Tokpelaia sp.]